MRTIDAILGESLQVKQELAEDVGLRATIDEAAALMVDCFRNGGRTMFCGNGGSAADAQHFAAELSGRFLIDRDPLPAEALHSNTSFLTGVANDYDYDLVFARAVRSSGHAGDVLIALSTSGRSRNVVRAMEAAKGLGISTIALTGRSGGDMRDLATVWLPMPSEVTARIQEAHIAVIHAISEVVEASLFEPPGTDG
jgi:D-sedoheptulose 7-phosphate isomerase